MAGSKKSYRVFLGAAGTLCVLAAVLSLCLGTVTIGPRELLKIFRGEASPLRNILYYARIPRTLGCLLAGAALSVAGAVLQKVLHNPLASPGIVGVNAGAGFGVTVCCALGLLSGWAVSLGAFLGSLGAVLLLFLLARWVGTSKTTLILCGVALNSILGALTESITVLNPDVNLLGLEFRVGGFSGVSYLRLLPAGVLIGIGLGLLLTLCNELDVVALGEDTARSVGLRVGACRMGLLLLAALLAGAAVSFSGLLGFVGLMVPQFVRRLCGSESSRLLPLSALTGGTFVTLSDLVARLLFRPYELPVGILMAVLGGPAFLWLLMKRKGGWKDA